MDPTSRQIIHDAMVRLSDGDRSAFPALVGALWPVVLAFAQRGWRGAAAPDAEDVAQQVFLRICERIAEFDRRRDALSWAFGIASYEILTLRRRRHRRREAGGFAWHAHPDPSDSQEETLMRRELAAAAQELVGELSAEDRALLGLGAETGDGLAARAPSPAALRKRRQRLLDRLRITWRRLHGEP
jgi:RNA polymerase sigma factor (sigma-70 family)